MNLNSFIDKLKNLEKSLQHLPGNIAVLAADMFDQNFEQQGFFGDAWKPSKRIKTQYRRELKRGSTLTQTGALRRSIRYQVNGMQIVFSSIVPYAKVHNEGLTIDHPGGTAYFKKKDGTTIWVSNRVANRMKSKNIDLPRTKAHEIPMPKRQFIGDHPILRAEIEKHIMETINDIFKF